MTDKRGNKQSGMNTRINVCTIDPLKTAATSISAIRHPYRRFNIATRFKKGVGKHSQ
jgi:hypothetical protein